PPSVNPNNFPAKLWQLVNSPRYPSISWDARGEGVLIDQPRFEGELLSDRPGAATSIFKTKNFSSFIRQLNLYGFHKVIGWAGSVVGLRPGPGAQAAGDNGGRSAWPLHHFQSPHFRRGRPDLLVNLKRLTKANKAKMVAGVGVTGSLSNRLQQ
ncbi:HSF5 protein, partial [Trogon melanurus]|nr:HSF5 protein [Trogon melanurus]